MPEIVAAYVAFNEADHIAESIRSIKAYVDRVVVVDAAFVTNPIEATHSTDAQREVVERACAAWPKRPLRYIESHLRLIEAEARNCYLNAIGSPDWCLVIDGDERLFGDWKEINRIFDAIRAGEVRGPLDVSVFTTACNLPKMAGDIAAAEYATAPLISTWGRMPRLFQVTQDVRYRDPGPGLYTPVLHVGDKRLVADQAVSPEALFLLNHHAGRTFASYQATALWETA